MDGCESDRTRQDCLRATNLGVALGLFLMASATSLPVFLLAWSVIGIGMALGLYEALFACLGALHAERAGGDSKAMTVHPRAFFSPFKRTFALCTAAIFSGRFMRFHCLMSSLLRPQLTHRSPLNWQIDMQGFSISLAIVNDPWTRRIAPGACSNHHHGCVGTPPRSRSGQCDLIA